MAKRIEKTTPKQDGFRMPGEFEPQEKVWMIWPERPDNWRDGGKPAQEAFAEVAKAISKFTPMNVVVSQQQYQNCRRQLPADITVYEMSNNVHGFVTVVLALSSTTKANYEAMTGDLMLGAD